MRGPFPGLRETTVCLHVSFQYHDSDSFRLERNTYADFIRSLEETLRSTDVQYTVTLAANMQYKITHKVVNRTPQSAHFLRI